MTTEPPSPPSASPGSRLPRDAHPDELLGRIEDQRKRILIAESLLARTTRERDQANAALILLMRQRNATQARLSLALLERMRLEVMDLVFEEREGDLLVSLQMRSPVPPAAPLGRTAGEEVSEAEGGGTPCATRMDPPE